MSLFDEPSRAPQKVEHLINAYLYDVQATADARNAQDMRSLLDSQQKIQIALDRANNAELEQLKATYYQQYQEVKDEISWRRDKGKTVDEARLKLEQALGDLIQDINHVLNRRGKGGEPIRKTTTSEPIRKTTSEPPKKVTDMVIFDSESSSSPRDSISLREPPPVSTEKKSLLSVAKEIGIGLFRNSPASESPLMIGEIPSSRKHTMDAAQKTTSLPSEAPSAPKKLADSFEAPPPRKKLADSFEAPPSKSGLAFSNPVPPPPITSNSTTPKKFAFQPFRQEDYMGAKQSDRRDESDEQEDDIPQKTRIKPSSFADHDDMPPANKTSTMPPSSSSIPRESTRSMGMVVPPPKPKPKHARHPLTHQPIKKKTGSSDAEDHTFEEENNDDIPPNINIDESGEFIVGSNTIPDFTPPIESVEIKPQATTKKPSSTSKLPSHTPPTSLVKANLKAQEDNPEEFEEEFEEGEAITGMSPEELVQAKIRAYMSQKPKVDWKKRDQQDDQQDKERFAKELQERRERNARKKRLQQQQQQQKQSQTPPILPSISQIPFFPPKTTQSDHTKGPHHERNEQNKKTWWPFS